MIDGRGNTIPAPEQQSGSRRVLLHGYADTADTWRGILVRLEEAGLKTIHRVGSCRSQAWLAPPMRPMPARLERCHECRDVVTRRPELAEVGWNNVGPVSQLNAI